MAFNMFLSGIKLVLSGSFPSQEYQHSYNPGETLRDKVVQKSLLSRRFRERAEIVHQLAHIYLDILSPTCTASMQSRDPLFKHFRKQLNQVRFLNCSHRRDHLVFGSQIPAFKSFFKCSNKKILKGNLVNPPLQLSKVTRQHCEACHCRLRWVKLSAHFRAMHIHAFNSTEPNCLSKEGTVEFFSFGSGSTEGKLWRVK
jgi:hypothetical protein